MTFPRMTRATLSLTALLMISACAAVGPDPTALPDTRTIAVDLTLEGLRMLWLKNRKAGS